MDRNLEWPVEINISIQKKKETSIMDLVTKFKLEFEKASPIHVTGVANFGLKRFPSFLEEEFFPDTKAVGFSVLDHFLSDTDRNIPEAWGSDHLYGGDVLVNKHGIKFIIKISRTGEKVQFIPLVEKHNFDPRARFICLSGNM